MFIKANAPFLIAGALASLILLTSGVFTVAPYVAFLAPIAALGVALPVTLTLFVLSAVVIALSYKIISQNKRVDVKEIELNEKNRLAKEQENTIKNLETKIKELDEAKQKLGDGKNKLTQNIKELESEKVKSALENKNKIEGLETKVKELDEAKQKLEVQLSAKDLELTNIKQELENLKNEQAQKNDSGYYSNTNTPTTFSGRLSPESILNRPVEYLEPYKENQKRQTEATREGQDQERRLISPGSCTSLTSLEDNSSLEEEDITSLTSSVEDFETAANSKKKIIDLFTQLLNIALDPEMDQVVKKVSQSFDIRLNGMISDIKVKQKTSPNKILCELNKELGFLIRILKIVDTTKAVLYELNAQAPSNPNMQPTFRSRSSSLSSPGGSNNDQPGPSSKLSETPLISRSQSLSFLNSSNSDLK